MDITTYFANIIASLVQARMRYVSKTLATGKESLINSGNNNVITFPVIVSSDIPQATASDIAKDIETLLGMATKNFIEGEVTRNTSELSMTAIMSSLPFTRMNAGITDNRTSGDAAYVTGLALNGQSENGDDTTGVYAEALRRAGNRLQKVNYYGEADGVQIMRDKGSGPTFIQVEVPYIANAGRNGSSGEVKTVKVQLGFEGVIRFVDVDEFVTRIGNFDSNRFFKNFIKLSKGEISFMGDFLLEMDRLRVEAKSQATSNKLWKTLELMNRKRDIFVRSFPFTTFVISDEVADRIKERYMIDTENERQIKALMESFFAFAFYEVNTGTNVVKVMKDGDAMYKTLTLDDIERNTTKVERKLKELIKIGG